MDIRVKYIETQANPSVKRRGGVILKGNARTDRQPVHLYFLIDTSGSMHMDEKLMNVQRSMNFILPFLTPQDQISLGSFSSDAKSHITRNPVSAENKQAIEYKIQQMTPDGNTNLSAGLLMTSSVFQEVQTDGIQRKQGLIVLTDGHANVGLTKEPQLLELVRNLLAKTPSLSITTVAYGEDHNADLLSKMSIEGGGSYNIVKNLEDVASVFGEILGGLLSVSAQMIEIHLPPDVECDTVYPTEVTEGGITKIRIGDLYSEAEQTLLFKSAPEQGPIRVTAVTLPGFEQLDVRVDPELLGENQEPEQTLQMADYRQQVSKLLKDSRTQVNNPTIKQRATDLLAILEASPFKDNLLIKMMIDDLKCITEQDTALHAVTMLAQHETYLGTAKGLRSPTNGGHRRIRLARSIAAPANTPIGAGSGSGQNQDDEQEQTSVFSNVVQRSITNELRTMSNRPY